MLQTDRDAASSPPAASSSARWRAATGSPRSGPGGKPEGVWALPKGLISPGENAELTALREVAEETGLEGTSLGKLGDVRYVYFRGERIFKVVSFYLFRYRRGRIGEIPARFRHEVAEARWLPLEDAPRLLAYKGEREMAQKALMMLAAGGPT